MDYLLKFKPDPAKKPACPMCEAGIPKRRVHLVPLASRDGYVSYPEKALKRLERTIEKFKRNSS